MSALEGKRAWVTGAGSGIGRAIALALAREGAHLTLSGRRRVALEETRTAVEAIAGSAEVAPLDATDDAAVATTAEAILAREGRIDILVNNAGGNVRERHFADLTPAVWARLVAVNLNAAYYCAAAVLPAMRAQGDGLIVNVASWAGRYHSYVSGPAYGAAKHGMVALNASLNMEEGVHGIRATAICPGEVATPILDARPEPVSADERARMLQPPDIAAAVVFVAALPAHVCVNEILISPTWNRAYVGREGRL